MIPLLIACTTCTPNQGGTSQDAYVWMTVMMCLVPLFAIGGVVLWLRHEARKAAAGEEPAGKVTAAGFDR